MVPSCIFVKCMSNEPAGPVNLPPDTAGLRAGLGMRKNRSYQWLEAACDPQATSTIPESGELNQSALAMSRVARGAD